MYPSRVVVCMCVYVCLHAPAITALFLCVLVTSGLHSSTIGTQSVTHTDTHQYTHTQTLLHVIMTNSQFPHIVTASLDVDITQDIVIFILVAL